MNQIKDALPVPTHCNICCSVEITFTTNDTVYGKTYGKWPYIYRCEGCKAYVGCHEGTKIPLGVLADRSTRNLRVKAHEELDKLWRSGLMSRAKAYNWLAGELGIDTSQCHISWLTKDQLKDVATLSSDHYNRNYETLLKRKVKQDAKQSKRNERDDEYERVQRKKRSARKARIARRNKDAGVAY